MNTLLNRRGVMMGLSKEVVPASDGKLWCYYNITDTENATTLTYAKYITYITGMWVDGVQVTVAGSYLFSTTGEHLVQFAISNLWANEFRGINALSSVYVPDWITTIPQTFLTQNSGVRKVVLPSSLTSLGNSAFSMTTGLHTIVFRGSTPPTLGTNVFSGVNKDIILFVPYSSDHSVLTAYQQTFSDRSKYIFELAQDGSIPVHKVSYIESSGTQYILLYDKKPAPTTDFIIDAAILSQTGYFGGWKSNAKFNMGIINSKWGVEIYNITYTFDSLSLDTSRHTFEFKGDGSCAVDSTTGQSSGSLTSTLNNTSMNIFACATARDGTPGTTLSSMRLYGAVVKENGSTLLDLVPVRIGQVGGLMDTLTGKIRVNEGTGSFILGSDTQ